VINLTFKACALSLKGVCSANPKLLIDKHFHIKVKSFCKNVLEERGGGGHLHGPIRNYNIKANLKIIQSKSHLPLPPLLSLKRL